MKEREIETEILVWLNKQPGCFAFKINQSGYFDGKNWRARNNGSLKGVADILGIWQKRPLAVEVKSVVGRLSQEQKNFLDKFMKEGGISITARSVEDVVKQLASLKAD